MCVSATQSEMPIHVCVGALHRKTSEGDVSRLMPTCVGEILLDALEAWRARMCGELDNEDVQACIKYM